MSYLDHYWDGYWDGFRAATARERVVTEPTPEMIDAAVEAVQTMDPPWNIAEYVATAIAAALAVPRGDLDLPDDIRECCEVLREDTHSPDGLEPFIEAATWQLLDYLGVL